MLLRNLHPSYWNWRHYTAVLVFLLGLNLFGPKGIIHWILVKQESMRLEDKKVELESKVARLKAELDRFDRSDLAKIHAIHDELGYLRDDEISFEFTESSQ